jgi:hypothetical protein
MGPNPKIAPTFTAALIIASLLPTASARDVTHPESALPSSPVVTSGEFLMNYYVFEERPLGTLVGNAVIDFGLDLKYEPDVVARLRFRFLQPSSVHGANRGLREAGSQVVRSTLQERQPHRHPGIEPVTSKVTSGSDVFSIEERTGIIRTRRHIDREDICSSLSSAESRASVGPEVCVFKLDIAVTVTTHDVGDGNEMSSRVQVKYLSLTCVLVAF